MSAVVKLFRARDNYYFSRRQSCCSCFRSSSKLGPSFRNEQDTPPLILQATAVQELIDVNVLLLASCRLYMVVSADWREVTTIPPSNPLTEAHGSGLYLVTRTIEDSLSGERSRCSNGKTKYLPRRQSSQSSNVSVNYGRRSSRSEAK